MGGKLSLFDACKGITKTCKPRSTEPNSPALVLCTSGPSADQILNPSGYRYFDDEEEEFYDTLLVKEEKVHNEVIAPKHVQTSEILGQGSFGRVLFGANMDTGQLMAIKQIPIIGFSYETAHEHFKEIHEEVEILSGLRHKNIVGYLGINRDEQFLNIYLEYVAGGSIASLLNKYGKFNETLIRVYTKQILEGLEYLHYHKIIHRDIKGANVLVTNDGVCKLSDFGASKRIIGLIDQTQFKSLRGTVNWMAPEVMKEEGHGRFADIWSLGCLVVEMATGKPPWYYKTNPIAVLMHVCTTDTLPELPPELSDAAKDFVYSCFRRNPCERLNVHKLLNHPFVQGTITIPHFISYHQAEEVIYGSGSTKFTSEEKGAFLSGSLANSTFREEVKEEETPKRLSDEINDASLDPSHNVKAPFGNIITIKKFAAAPEGQDEEIILRRPSTLSEENEEHSQQEEEEEIEIQDEIESQKVEDKTHASASSNIISNHKGKCNENLEIKMSFPAKEVDV